jgi:GNAT superfamily N-acetyltransferase
MNIRPYAASDAEEIVALSLLAWAPVFASFEQVMGPAVYARIYPDWRAEQAAAVLELCAAEKSEVWVAEDDGTLAGFILWELDQTNLSGEVAMLAVHPDAQQRGVATMLNEFALAAFKEAGMTVAQVMTGGDPGHAPARRAYEKVGYTPLPLVRYYKVL